MPHGVCEKPEEGRHKSTFSQWLPYPHRIDRGPGWSPCEANPKGLGLRHVLESGARHWLGTVPTTGLSPRPEQAWDFTADPPAYRGCTSSASGADRAQGACCCPSWHSAPRAWHRRGPATWSPARTSLGPLTDSWRPSPSLRGALRTHTSHGLRWTLYEDGITWRITPPLPGKKGSR